MTSPRPRTWLRRGQQPPWGRCPRFARPSAAEKATPRPRAHHPPVSFPARSGLCGLFLGDLDDHGLPLAFAPLREPPAQPLGKALWRQAEAGFDLPIGYGQGVVKIRGIREIAHAELIEPIERAGAAPAANEDIYFEFLRVHPTIITSR